MSKSLGFTDPKTLLNSGNVVFKGAQEESASVAARIAEAIAGSHPFTANVVGLTLAEFEEVIDSNPFPVKEADSPRFLVAFTARPELLDPLQDLLACSWGDERIAVRGRAAFLSMPGGVADSELRKAFEKATRDAATARNWATVLKLQNLAELAFCKGPEDRPVAKVLT